MSDGCEADDDNDYGDDNDDDDDDDDDGLVDARHPLTVFGLLLLPAPRRLQAQTTRPREKRKPRARGTSVP